MISFLSSSFSLFIFSFSSSPILNSAILLLNNLPKCMDFLCFSFSLSQNELILELALSSIDIQLNCFALSGSNLFGLLSLKLW